MDNFWRGLRELHIWTAAWSSTVMSGRLDAFFSLSLCHVFVVSVLFASALSFYAPVSTAYYQHSTLTVLVFWVAVLFTVALLTSVIQLVMRMLRVRSGKLLQRYHRVGAVLVNPSANAAYPPRQNWTGNNSRTTSSILRQRNTSSRNNNNNDSNNNGDDDDVGTTLTTGELVDVDATSCSQLNQHLPSVEPPFLDDASVQHHQSPNTGCFEGPTSRPGSPSDPFGELSGGFWPMLPCDRRISRPILPSPLLPLPPLPSTAVSCSNHGYEPSERFLTLWCPAGILAADDADRETDLNMNNSNNDQLPPAANQANTVSAAVQASRDLSPNAELIDNFSSNAGSEDVPRVSRLSSAARPSRSSAGQSIAAPRSSSTAMQEQRRSSASGRQSGVETRRSTDGRASSSREASVVDRRSSTGQSMSQAARRSSARQSGVDARRSSAGQPISQEQRRSSARESEPRRSSAAESRRSSAGGRQSDFDARRSSAGQSVSQEARRSSARQSGVDARRSSAGQSMSMEERRSSGGGMDPQISSAGGPEEPRRSSAAARGSSVDARRSSAGQSISQEERRSSAGGFEARRSSVEQVTSRQCSIR